MEPGLRVFPGGEGRGYQTLLFMIEVKKVKILIVFLITEQGTLHELRGKEQQTLFK